MSKAKTGAEKIVARYVGEAPAINRDVGRATGEGDLLVPGQECEVPRELAESLAGSAAWELAATTKGAKA